MDFLTSRFRRPSRHLTPLSPHVVLCTVSSELEPGFSQGSADGAIGDRSSSSTSLLEEIFLFKSRTLPTGTLAGAAAAATGGGGGGGGGGGQGLTGGGGGSRNCVTPELDDSLFSNPFSIGAAMTAIMKHLRSAYGASSVLVMNVSCGNPGAMPLARFTDFEGVTVMDAEYDRLALASVSPICRSLKSWLVAKADSQLREGGSFPKSAAAAAAAAAAPRGIVLLPFFF